MLVRNTKKLAKFVLNFIIFGILILAALYVSIGRIAVNAVDHFNEDLTELLTSSLGTRVSLGELKGSWNRFDPTITVSQLVIGSINDPAIVIGEITFRLSFWFTLTERTPVLSEIHVNGLSLALEQSDDNSWAVKGLPSSDASFSFDLILDSAAHVEEITLENLDMDILGLRSTHHIGSELNLPLKLRRSEDERVISFPLLVERVGDSDSAGSSRVNLSGVYTGDLRDLSNIEANIYFEMPQVQLTDFLPELKFQGVRLGSAGLRAELWLDYQNENFNLVGNIEAHEIELIDTEGHKEIVQRIDTTFKLSGHAEQDEVQLFLPDLSLIQDGEVLEFLDLNLIVEMMDGQYVVAGNLPSLDLGSLSSTLIRLNENINVIPERGMTALVAMNLKGHFEEIILYFDNSSDKPEMKLTSSIVGASIEAYLGAPAISALNGFVSLHPERGYVDINNSAFDLHFASMFPSSWPFDSTRGRVNYRLADGVFHLNSGLIELISGDLSGYGKVHIRLPRDRDDQTWGLIIGVNNADLLEASRFLPNTLSAEFLDWLNQAVLGGLISETALLFHGSLYRGAPKVRKVYELYLKVEESELDYDPNWPRVSNLDATIYINNRGVFADDAIATILDSKIIRSRFEILIPIEGEINNIHIEADLIGPLNDGIRVLNETPLAEATNNMAEGWTGTGDLNASAILDIPIGPRSGEELLSDVTVSLAGNDLTMPLYDLTLYQIDARINYRNAQGLSAEKIDALIFGKPVTGSIVSDINLALDDRSGEIVVHGVGEVDIRDLQRWSGQALLSTSTGIMEYEASIHVPFGQPGASSYVETTSNLTGIVIDMPAPMKKESAESEMSLIYKQTFLESSFLISLQLGDQVRAALEVEDGIVSGGKLTFGGLELVDIDYQKLKVDGRMAAVNYEEWDQFFKKLDLASEVALESELADTLDAIVLDIDSLDIYSMELPAVKVTIKHQDSAWFVRLFNVNLKGTVLVHDDEGKPIDVNLDYLRFFDDEVESAFDEDPFADIIPQEMFAVNFSTQELTIDQVDYGSWKFDFRPNENGADFFNLTADVKGMSFVEPSSANWQYENGVHQSSFDGLVKVENLADMLEQWGYASSVEGKDFNLTSSFSWAGSPAMVALETVEGSLFIDGAEGRFIQADSGTAALKILGIFDFNQIMKRMKLDFSDVVEKGYSFNAMKGGASFDNGIIDISEPIFIKSAGSDFTLGGTVNLLTRELDGDVVVTLPVGKNLEWYAVYSAIFTGPLVGAGVFLAQKLFEDQIDQITSAKWKVTGTIEEPEIVLFNVFDNSVRESASENIEAEVSESVEAATAEEPASDDSPTKDSPTVDSLPVDHGG
jgi:uncharacterized protein (TIGR02099 family)